MKAAVERGPLLEQAAASVGEAWAKAQLAALASERRAAAGRSELHRPPVEARLQRAEDGEGQRDTHRASSRRSYRRASCARATARPAARAASSR